MRKLAALISAASETNEPNKRMLQVGRITRALSALAERIKADRGASDINEMEHLQPLGDDSKPLPQDDGWSDRTSENGNDVYFGAFDYDNKIAEPGEKRIYARDADGVPVNQVYLKKDGEIITSNDNCSVTQNPDGTIISTNGTSTITQLPDGTTTLDSGSATHTVKPDGSVESVNGSGSIKLLPDGSVDINGFIISPSGLAKDSSGIGLDTHGHTQPNDSAGNTEERTDSASEL